MTASWRSPAWWLGYSITTTAFVADVAVAHAAICGSTGHAFAQMPITGRLLYATSALATISGHSGAAFAKPAMGAHFVQRSAMAPVMGHRSRKKT
jgi:hypothetical protein